MQGVQVQFLVRELRSDISWGKSTSEVQLMSPRATARESMRCNERSGVPELRLNTGEKINKYLKKKIAIERLIIERIGGGQGMPTFLLSVFNDYFYINLARLRYVGFPGGSDGKASACNVGDPGSTPGWEDPLGKEMATCSSTLAWKIPWTEEPGRLQSMGSQRVGHDWVTSLRLRYVTSRNDPHILVLQIINMCFFLT